MTSNSQATVPVFCKASLTGAAPASFGASQASIARKSQQTAIRIFAIM